MKRLLLSVVLVLLSAQAMAQLQQGTITLRQSYQNWEAFLLTISGSTYARTSSISIEGDILLTIDRTGIDCAPSLVFMVYTGPLGKDNSRPDVTLSFRADSGRRFDLQGTSSITMGDEFGQVLLNSTPQFSDLMSELRRGASLRTKIMFGDNESGAIYSTFSLRGFTAAQLRAEELCNKPFSRPGKTARPNRMDRL